METNLPDRVEALFAKEIITREEYDSLDEQEKKRFAEKRNELLKNGKGTKLDEILTKIGPLLPKDAKEDIWETNHRCILSVINNVLATEHRMPSISQIAEKAQISRITVRKHLDEYKKESFYTEKEERFKAVRETLLTVLFNKAVRGDVNALKYYFEATGMANEGNSARKGAMGNVIENQHNYIQINNLRLSQEEIQKLSPEKLTQIERVIRG